MVANSLLTPRDVGASQFAGHRSAATYAVPAVDQPSPESAPGRGPVTILFISANPGGSDPLATEEEYRAIEQQIRLARHRDAFRLIFKAAARRGDLHDALLEHAPHIVHFACHGSAQAEVYLRTDGPGSDPVPAESLASLFQVLHDRLVLVVFNACFASAQAAAIRQPARAAIGMRSRVTDRSAIEFASALYRALAYGRSVQEAFRLGVAALDGPDNQIPQLFTAGEHDVRVLPPVESAVPGRPPRAYRTPLLAIACTALAAAAAAAASRPRQEPRDPAPFVLEARLRAERTIGGSAITLGDLHSGDVVIDDDHLQVAVRTSTAGYLYVAFCSQLSSDPRRRVLRVIPQDGGIPVAANQVVLAPPAPASLVVDTHPGDETLYVILTHNELALGDAALAEVLLVARRSTDTAECGETFEDAVQGPRATGTTRHRHGDKAREIIEPRPRARDRDPHGISPDRDQPAANIERGVNVVWGPAQSGIKADPDGIVVLRYDLVHVAR